VLRDELADGRCDFSRDFDDHLLECRLVFGDCFVFALLRIVAKNLPHARLIPSFGKLCLLHGLPFLLRRLRYAASGLPFKSYAVITKELSGSGSGT